MSEAFAPLVVLSNGCKMPILGLGTWLSQPGDIKAAVKHAVRAGYRHFDCAALYDNEKEVGEGLKEAMKECDVTREDLFITSKLWNNKHHPDDIEPECRKSLADLGLDYLDLYLIHWPHAYQRGDSRFPADGDGNRLYDLDLHPTDTYLAMEKLVDQGLVRSLGLSNFNSRQVEDVVKKARIGPVVNQVECHPLYNQSKLLEFCRNRKVELQAYSPLGSPNRSWAPENEKRLLDHPAIHDIAKKHNKSEAQVLIRYQIDRGVTVLPKSCTPSRIEANAAVFDFSLTEEDMKLLNGLHRPDGRIILPILEDGNPRDAVHPHHTYNTSDF